MPGIEVSQRLQIRRHVADATPPASLLEGELEVDLFSTPPRLHVGPAGAGAGAAGVQIGPVIVDDTEPAEPYEGVVWGQPTAKVTQIRLDGSWITLGGATANAIIKVPTAATGNTISLTDTSYTALKVTYAVAHAADIIYFEDTDTGFTRFRVDKNGTIEGAGGWDLTPIAGGYSIYDTGLARFSAQGRITNPNNIGQWIFNMAATGSGLVVSSDSGQAAGFGYLVFYNDDASELRFIHRVDGYAHWPQQGMGIMIGNNSEAGQFNIKSATGANSAYVYMGKDWPSPVSGTRTVGFEWWKGVNQPGQTLVAYVNQLGNVGSTGAVTVLSDERTKFDIEPLSRAGIPDVMIDQIAPMRFRREPGGPLEYGFSAQQLQPLVPEAVVPWGEDPMDDTLGVQETQLIPLLLFEIQQLRQRVAALES